jgi:hypothetical protein
VKNQVSSGVEKGGKFDALSPCNLGLDATTASIVKFYFDTINLTFVTFFIPLIQCLKKWVIPLPKGGAGMGKKMDVVNTQFRQ